MASSPSSKGATSRSPSPAADPGRSPPGELPRARSAPAAAAQRRTAGIVAGGVISLGAMVALAAAEIVRHPRAPTSFYVLGLVAVGTGVLCVLMPWDRMPARWLHTVPVLATIEVTIGVRLVGVYGDIAADYFIFVVVFVSYAFSTRRAVAAQVAFASAASSLPLLYPNPNPAETAARTLIWVVVLVVVAGIVTLLREGLEARQRELEVLAVHDPLTGVGNYRLLSDRLDDEILRHRRSGASLTVMLLDLDGFKEINDTLGHLAGDRVLQAVAAALSSAVRAQDTLARQGGDEFTILAPDTTDEQAERLATRVRDAVIDAPGAELTTSIGWVTCAADALDADTLLTLADAELRRAKRERGICRGEAAARTFEPVP